MGIATIYKLFIFYATRGIQRLKADVSIFSRDGGFVLDMHPRPHKHSSQSCQISIPFSYCSRFLCTVLVGPGWRFSDVACDRSWFRLRIGCLWALAQHVPLPPIMCQSIQNNKFRSGPGRCLVREVPEFVNVTGKVLVWLCLWLLKKSFLLWKHFLRGLPASILWVGW
jgi:hypothetical protein